MAKVRGPLLSLSARGQIAKTMVIAQWKGIQYARQHVVPSNPNTVAQQATRTVFSSIDDQMKKMLGVAQAPWKTAAAGRPFTARNRFIQANLPVLRLQPDMSAYVASPGVNGGLPGLNFVAAPGALAGEVDVSLDVGQAPVGWSAGFVSFTLFPDRDPALLLQGFVMEAQETGPGDVYTPPVTVSHTFTGLTSTTSYVASAWIVWTRADLVIAPGPSQTGLATAT